MASSTPLSKANTSFCLALLKKLSDDNKTANVFYSPFSISSALAMVLLGAGGNTATQMSEVLGFTDAQRSQDAGAEQQQQQRQQRQQCLRTQECQGDVNASFAQLLRELNKGEALYTLSVANRLYGEQSYQFLPDFLVQTRKYYDAELESVDFINKYEAARLQINSWVEKQTQDKIKNLLAKGVVNNMTRMVLVNAIYFKGSWKEQFEESETKEVPFKLNKTDTKPVKMMHLESRFPLNYISEVNCQVLELPYKGKELSMLIFLPRVIEDSSTGLEKLEKGLTYENFVEWTRPDTMDSTKVEVGLPRFKMAETYDMKEILESMGIVDAFDVSKSDFSGMSAANDLVLSKVVHKSFVEVNEEGTEAAAATAVTVGVTSVRITSLFIADHPFLFFIRHNSSMSVLFAGRYCSPE